MTELKDHHERKEKRLLRCRLLSLQFEVRNDHSRQVIDLLSANDISAQVVLSQSNRATFVDPGFTLLHIAARHDSQDCTTVLLAKGAAQPETLNMWLNKQCDKYRSTALHVAAQCNHVDVGEALLKAGALGDKRTTTLRTPLHQVAQVARTGGARFAEALLKAGAELEPLDIANQTPLYVAACSGNVDVMKLLLEAGANPNRRAKTLRTPLIRVAQMIRPVWDENQVLKAMHLLIQAGADPNAADDRGCNALHYAAEAGLLWACRLLSGTGIDLLAKNHEGLTAEEVAKRGGRGGVLSAGHGAVVAFLMYECTVKHSALLTAVTVKQPVETIVQCIRHGWINPDDAVPQRDLVRRCAEDGHVGVVEATLTNGQTNPVQTNVPGALPRFVKLALQVHWSPANSHLYPRKFREAVWAIMMTRSKITSADLYLPQEMWFRIIGFLSRADFPAPVQPQPPIEMPAEAYGFLTDGGSPEPYL